MYFKLCLFAVCVYGVCCLSEEDARNKCMAEFKLTSDDPLNYFYKHGKLQPEYEHAKCFFNCFARTTEIADEKGAPIIDRLSANDRLAVENCTPPPDGFTPCDVTFVYASCIAQWELERKAAALKKSGSK